MSFFVACAGCSPTHPPKAYRDTDVQARLAPFASRGDNWSLTDIVPNGETRPLKWVFATLNLEQTRLIGQNVCGGANMVGFVCFQISPSYEMQVMTGWEDVFDDHVQPNEKRAADPNLQVYGIRFRRTATVP